jgi:mannose/fructose/N-acetylgalactosamine-specific phosphotransferase system component IIC
MGEFIFRIILSFGLFLLVFSLFALAIVKPDTPEFVPAVLSVAFNLITVIGAALVVRYLRAKNKKRE